MITFYELCAVSYFGIAVNIDLPRSLLIDRRGRSQDRVFSVRRGLDASAVVQVEAVGDAVVGCRSRTNIHRAFSTAVCNDRDVLMQFQLFQVAAAAILCRKESDRS